MGRRSTRRFNEVAVQTAVGLFWLGVYAVICLFVLDWEIGAIVATVLPYFICYEAGVLSRYLPGVRTAAKRLE